MDRSAGTPEPRAATEGPLGWRPRDLGERKNLKVKLPLRLHLQLQAMRLFDEANVSRTVEEALDLYFEQRHGARPGDAPAAAAGAAPPQGSSSQAPTGAADAPPDRRAWPAPTR